MDNKRETTVYSQVLQILTIDYIENKTISIDNLYKFAYKGVEYINKP